MTTYSPLVLSNGKIVQLPSGSIISGAPAGEQGIQGPTGATGPTGPTGPTGASGGGVVLVEQHTASSGDATMDFTTGITSTYDSYRLELVGFRPATTSVNILLRVGTGAGPTWDSSSNYKWALNRVSDSAVATPTGSTGTTSITIANGSAGLSNGSTDTVDINIYIKHPGDANHKTFYWNGYCVTTAPAINMLTGAAQYIQTTALTGIRLLFSSGNIAAGIGRLYGIAKV